MTFAARTHWDSPLGATVIVASYLNTAVLGSTCQIQFRTNGDVYVEDENGAFVRYQWKIGGGAGGDYQVRWQNTAGTLSFGTAGVYHRLDVDRTYGVLFDGIGAKQCNGVVTIQEFAAPNTQLASASVTLRAVGTSDA
jgi:hypothetical protein